MEARIRRILEQRIAQEGGYSNYGGVSAGVYAAGSRPRKGQRQRAYHHVDSDWIEFVKAFRAQNPGMSYKEAMIEASPYYRQQHGVQQRAAGYGGAVLGGARRPRARPRMRAY